LNRKSHGVLPVAVLGTMDFDVTTIDVATVRLAPADGVGGEVASLEGPPGPDSLFEDAATPFERELRDCRESGADGYLDLSMKFSSQDVATACKVWSADYECGSRTCATWLAAGRAASAGAGFMP
jgi:hypothetical protein